MISIRHLSKTFVRNEVLKDISLEIADAEIVAIMGSSGGGKTTLLRCVSGLIRPTSGEVEVAGVNVEKEPDEARKHMGMVFQSSALFDFLSVRANVEFGLDRRMKLHQKERREQVDASLELVGLQDSQSLMPSEISGGMKKRVGIARALVLQPEVMLYDEPTTGLDPVTTYTIDQLIVEVRRERKVTSLLVSHDVSSVLRVADRIAFLEAGELAFVGTPTEFKGSRNAAILELVDKSQAETLSPAH